MQFCAQYVVHLNLRRFGKPFVRISHQGCSNLTRQVRLSPGLIRVDVKNTEARVADLIRHPNRRSRFLLSERHRTPKVIRDSLFHASFGFQSHQQSNSVHEFTFQAFLTPEKESNDSQRNISSGNNGNNAIVSAMRVEVLALNGIFDTGLAVILDAFAAANELAAAGRVAVDPFEVSVVGLRRQVRTGQGLIVPVISADKFGSPDIAIIPALSAKMPQPLERALNGREVLEANELIHAWSRMGAILGAACTGTFVLADTSLLDGQTATTTWWLAPMFRERYPKVKLDESKMLVGSARAVTAGAALGHLDLALWLIRHHSPALAALTARYMVIDPRPSQAAFVIPDHLAHTDALVERFEHWVRPRLADGFSIGEAARAVGSSERTLSRRFRQTIGKTPLSFVQDLRVERAVQLLQTENASVDDIALEVGYADGVTLRTLLRRKMGRGIRELRMRG
jgi:transcriptional regulator GlxA family with amidase domain